MHNILEEQVADVTRAWMESSTSEPLLIVKNDDSSVTVTRGYSKQNIAGTQAAKLLGISWKTLKLRYLDTGILIRNKHKCFSLDHVMKERKRIAKGNVI